MRVVVGSDVRAMSLIKRSSQVGQARMWVSISPLVLMGMPRFKRGFRRAVHSKVSPG